MRSLTRSLPRLLSMTAVLVALLTCAATAAAQGPDVSVSNLSGASIFNGAQPETSSSTDPNAVELGLRFESSVPVAIEGIRFFKGQGDTGTHVGHLWSSTGTLLASATFSEETAYGWQSVKFAKPVVIEPHTVYVASYYAPVGGYAFTHFFFENAPYVSGPITALQGVNGVYKYGSTSEFPTETYRLQQLLRGHPLLDRRDRRPAGHVRGRHGQRRQHGHRRHDAEGPAPGGPLLDAGRPERMLDPGRHADVQLRHPRTGRRPRRAPVGDDLRRELQPGDPHGAAHKHRDGSRLERRRRGHARQVGRRERRRQLSAAQVSRSEHAVPHRRSELALRAVRPRRGQGQAAGNARWGDRQRQRRRGVGRLTARRAPLDHHREACSSKTEARRAVLWRSPGPPTAGRTWPSSDWWRWQ